MSTGEATRPRRTARRAGRRPAVVVALVLLVLVAGVATALALVRDAPVVPTAVQEHPSSDGCAALRPDRPVVLAVVGEGGTRSVRLPVHLADVAPGQSATSTATVDAPTALGDHELELALPAPAAALAERPEHAVRLADESTWDAATARNDLHQSLRVRDPAEEAGTTP